MERRENLGARVNSELDEYHPSLSPGRKVLFFVRHSYEPWIPGDICYIPVRALQSGPLSGESIRTVLVWLAGERAQGRY